MSIRLSQLVLATVFAVVTAQSVSAETISINWKEFAGGVNDVLDGYGVEPANNWQNLQQINVGTDVPMSSGAASTVDFTTTVPGGWDTFGFAAQNNTPMRAGLALFDGAPNPINITLSDLSSTFVEYDVIVYVTGFNAFAGGNIGSVTDGSSTFVYQVPSPFTSDLIQSIDTDPNDGADEATWVRFNDLTADTTVISLDSLNGAVGVGGIQITGTLVPEPTTAGLVILGGLAALRRRRR